MTHKKSFWTLNLFNLAGIPVRLHLTFFLLLLWVAMDASAQHKLVWLELVLIVTIFACVMLHELGHALTARLFGIRTRDIVLYPFGGIAALDSLPSPRAELVVALAGPAVNVVIAAALWPFAPYKLLLQDPPPELSAAQYYLSSVLVTNIALVVFNMIPAIPMDGGRVLRAALQLLRVRRATALACRVSQALSIIMGIAAIFLNNPILLVISVLVFSNSFNELLRSRAQLNLDRQSARDLMTDIERLQVFTHGSRVSEAIGLAFKSLQNFFPVLYGDQVLGVVDKDTLLKAAADENEQYVSGVMQREVSSLPGEATLPEVLSLLEASSGWPLLVLERGRLIGMIFKERLLERLLYEGLLKEQGQRGEGDA